MRTFSFEGTTGTNDTNQYEELIKIFLRPSEYRILNSSSASLPPESADYEYPVSGDKDEIKRKIYRDLSNLTGRKPGWGILTGIRPVKLAGELEDSGADVRGELRDKYYLSTEKIDLVMDILDYQRHTAGRPRRRDMSVYIGIPFCPTRCMYCSFTSNQVNAGEIENYLKALNLEIEQCGKMACSEGRNIESIYIGGGTPTTLDARQLDNLISLIRNSFDLTGLREFTVEAGRPDTITDEKLQVLHSHNVNRISINPQTMKQDTLDLIGRKHTVDDVYRAFNLADKSGIDIINTDLIAGLPGESIDDFAGSLREIIRLGASNITIHTLAVKRASRLKELDADYNYKNEEIRKEMITGAHEYLNSHGYRPYYLYRQKHTSGDTENTGFCKGDAPSVYNIRIMEEKQSILALGAGGISKVYFPDENRLERVPNVSNYQIYNERIDEMIRRKKDGFFVKAFAYAGGK